MKSRDFLFSKSKLHSGVLPTVELFLLGLQQEFEMKNSRKRSKGSKKVSKSAKHSKKASRNQKKTPPQPTKAKPNRIVFRMGKRVYIRPILVGDLPQITVWVNDHKVNQYLAILWPMAPEDELKWFESLRDRQSKDVVFGIVLEDTDELIGVMGLHRINSLHGTADTGSFIGRKDLWSKGYGTEAKMLVLEYAFNTLGLRKINSIVYDFNPRSARCLEKCGYEREGIRVAHKWRNGRFADEYEYAVFREVFMSVWEKYQKKFLGPQRQKQQKGKTSRKRRMRQK